MEIKARDTYKIIYSGGISEEILLSLTELYQPLIGPEAVNLFLTMAAEGMKQRTLQNHERLFTLCGISPDVFNRACARLEEYFLLRVYVKKCDSRDAYLYKLNVPMNAKAFRQTNIYMTRLQKAIGQKNMETTMALLSESDAGTQGYQDITREVRYSEAETKEASQYTIVQPRYKFDIDDVNINFDYERFISITSTTVFPIELRTEENLRLIGKLATVHGLSPDRMLILVMKCVDIDAMQFDSEKLILKAEQCQPDIKESKDPYSLSPASFLQGKQNGAKVTLPDQKILDHLALDMHFSNEVINVLIEYVLSVSDNRLNSRFVDMVAGEWARNGIATKEQALLQAKKQPNYGKQTKGRMNVPDYIEQQMKGELPKGTKADQEDIDRIKKLQEKMKG